MAYFITEMYVCHKSIQEQSWIFEFFLKLGPIMEISIKCHNNYI